MVGEIKVGGLTRKEIADKIKSELASNNLVYNAVVTWWNSPIWRLRCSAR